jgi:hypothetical protein
MCESKEPKNITPSYSDIDGEGSKKNNTFKLLDERKLEKSLEYVNSLHYVFNEQNINPDISKQINFFHNNTVLHITVHDKNKVKVNSDKDGRIYEFIGYIQLEISPFPPISLGTIKTIYRNLRENLEYWLRNEEADQVYEKEMEVRRKYRV